MSLIAILLGRLQMTTEEALETYDEVAETLFSKKNRKISANSQFKASTLADIVKKIVGQRTKGDLLRAEDTPPPKCKAFVCAIDEMELGAIHRLRTYETDNNKSDEWLRDCKIWEAARATTAAPLNFKAMTIERDTVKKSFVDAALGYNNPAEQLLDEACSVFHRERTLGALVSLGTGTRKMSLANAGSASAAGYLASLGKTLKNEATDTERAHQRIKGRLKRCPNTYYRFNVPYAADEVKLAAWKKMGELKDMTMDYVADEAVKRNIDDLVDLLLQKKKPEGLTLKYIGVFRHDIQLSITCADNSKVSCSTERTSSRALGEHSTWAPQAISLLGEEKS
jgi:predicted acylesterase/phospholipase RssA